MLIVDQIVFYHVQVDSQKHVSTFCPNIFARNTKEMIFCPLFTFVRCHGDDGFGLLISIGNFSFYLWQHQFVIKRFRSSVNDERTKRNTNQLSKNEFLNEPK